MNVPIPGSNINVDMHRLASVESGAASLLVRFPAAWRRDEVGHYLCDEEFIVIKGQLNLSGHVYMPGEYGFVPALGQRFASSVEGETWAVAWFNARPTWILDEESDPHAHEKTLKYSVKSPRVLREATAEMPLCVVGTDQRFDDEVEVIDVDRAVWTLGAPSATLFNRGRWQ
ncbi:MAG: hypothetical protein D4R44_05600 [Actinobacteria bacterium]|nr:MAG: hypothetical protein D4R44_05600 [Actinomycetota bacterium]